MPVNHSATCGVVGFEEAWSFHRYLLQRHSEAAVKTLAEVQYVMLSTSLLIS